MNDFEGRSLKPQKMGMEGEILNPGDEDPRVLRKFDELPAVIAEQWKGMSLKTRRMIVSDETILDWPIEKMVQDFIDSNPEYQSHEDRLAMLDALPTQSIEPVLETSGPMKNITPRTGDQARIEEIRKRLGYHN